MCQFAFEKLSESRGQLVYVARISGKLPHGSSGNSLVNEWVQRIEGELPRASGKEVGLVLDLTGLAYEWGDSLASLWLAPMSRNVSCVVVARGSTRTAIEELTKLSLPVDVVGQVREALRVISGAPSE